MKENQSIVRQIRKAVGIPALTLFGGALISLALANKVEEEISTAVTTIELTRLIADRYWHLYVSWLACLVYIPNLIDLAKKKLSSDVEYRRAFIFASSAYIVILLCQIWESHVQFSNSNANEIFITYFFDDFLLVFAIWALGALVTTCAYIANRSQ